MAAMVDEPEVGKFYENDFGVVVEVMEVKPNGYWLARFVKHPTDKATKGHKQWQLCWPRGVFWEVERMDDVGVPCACSACTQKRPAFAMQR